MAEVIITMPAYRAEATVARTVADIPAGLANRVILVDDASPDNTVRVARQLGIEVVTHPENRGYGGNQKTCYLEALAAGAEIIVLLHPDYQYDPKAVPLLIAPILAGDADMTFGSRFAGLGDPVGGGMPMYRFIGNRLTTVAENVMLGSRFTDMHSGLRAYSRSCLLSIPFQRYSDDFDFDSEFIIDAVTSGQRVVEVPIPTRYTKESSSINIVSSLRYIFRSLAYCAQRTGQRGRRGKRSPVTIKGRRRGPLLGGRGAVERRCVLCGDDRQALVFPATVSGDVPDDDFTCTAFALGNHDDIVQCARCGLVSALPPLSADEIVARYERVQDPVYMEEEEGRRELFGWICDAFGGYAVSGKRLFEAGSNVGLFLDVARSRGWDVSGVEPSRWAVEQGRKRFGVDLSHGTADAIDVQPGSVDVFVMLDVLEHVADPVAALRRAREALKPEGLLVLSTIDVNSRHARARSSAWPWFARSHLWYFTGETLSAMLAKAGFRMVEWSTVPRSFHLSYILHRGGSAVSARRGVTPSISSALEGVAAKVDPRVPIGWLGDVVFVAARPVAGA